MGSVDWATSGNPPVPEVGARSRLPASLRKASTDTITKVAKAMSAMQSRLRPGRYVTCLAPRRTSASQPGSVIW